jgi:transposase-like protein
MTKKKEVKKVEINKTDKVIKKKNTYTPQFKFDRSLDILRNSNISEIARKYALSTNLLYLWRDQFIERGVKIFETSPDQTVNELKARVARLEQMIGKKEVELNLLKNFSDFYSSQNTPL